MDRYIPALLNVIDDNVNPQDAISTIKA